MRATIAPLGRPDYDDVLHKRFVGTGRVTFLPGSDHRRNGLRHESCRASSAEWALMQARGARATAAFCAESDIDRWSNTCALSASLLP
jgi:hypothetical protein